MADHGPVGKLEETTAPQDAPHVEILEKGEIFFFYRPKVEVEHPTSIDDVQRMYMVIKPEKGKMEDESKQSRKSGKESIMIAEHNVDDDDKKLSTKDHEEDKTTKDRGKAEEESKQSHKSTKKSIKHDVDDGKKPSTKDHKEGKKTKDDEETKQDNHEDKSAASKKLEKGRHGGEGEEKVNIEKQDLYRFIILGRKSLPDASKRTRPYWAFVDLVTTNKDNIIKALGAEEYETATRGTRHKPTARPAGEGVYSILRHKGNQSHTHLIYKLELPTADHKGNSPQTELNIGEEGSFIIQVKNPATSTPSNIGLSNKRRATYPAHLQSNMGHYRFVSADPCDYLNYEGCEFILISASDDVEKELGVHLDGKHDEECSALLSLLGRNAPLNIKPLLDGEWA